MRLFRDGACGGAQRSGAGDSVAPSLLAVPSLPAGTRRTVFSILIVSRRK